MIQATIAELKNRLSAYLRKVRAGETVLVLDRNEPVARIERVTPAEQPDSRLARLSAAGLVESASRQLPLDVLRAKAPRSSASVLAALLDERREGR